MKRPRIIRKLGIHLTQVTPTYSVRARGGLSTNPGRVAGRFATEEACRTFLVQARWPEGFRCPRCGAGTAWPVRTVLWQCPGCGRQTSVTAGTIFQDTRTPLTTWFRAIWCVTSSKTGTSAEGQGGDSG